MKEFLDYLVKTWNAKGWEIEKAESISLIRIILNNNEQYLLRFKRDNYTDIIEYKEISIRKFLQKFDGCEFYTIFNLPIKVPDMIEWEISKMC